MTTDTKKKAVETAFEVYLLENNVTAKIHASILLHWIPYPNHDNHLLNHAYQALNKKTILT